MRLPPKLPALCWSASFAANARALSLNIRVRLNNFFEGRDVVVIVKCPDDDGRVCGKYLVGRHSTEVNVLALVFDAGIQFHPAIAKKYRLIPLGGGHFVVDHGEGSIRILGKSDTYGAELDRQFTARALETALPAYATFIEPSISGPDP